MKNNTRTIAGLVGVIILVFIIILILQRYTPETDTTVKTITGEGKLASFTNTGQEICLNEEGKPKIYLFSTTSCPHCKWIKTTFDQTIMEYVAEGKIEAHHYELDTGDDTLTSTKEKTVPSSDRGVFTQFSPQGYVPVYVLGCKYYRIGNAYEGGSNGLENEENDFREAIEAIVQEASATSQLE